MGIENSEREKKYRLRLLFLYVMLNDNIIPPRKMHILKICKYDISTTTRCDMILTREINYSKHKRGVIVNSENRGEIV